MSDPLTEIITLLRPATVFSKPIAGAGKWGVRYLRFGHPSFCAVLEGRCRLAVDGHPKMVLSAGDFVLLPATPAFTMSSMEPGTPRLIDPHTAAGITTAVRHGTRGGTPDVRLLGGYFLFDAADEGLLVSLLPTVVHLQHSPRLAQLVEWVSDETKEPRTGRDLVLTRLVEILLVEALRATSTADAPRGLLRGLADERLARAIRQMHAHLARPWTVPQLARIAVMSRSAFFDRFTRTVGVAPMAYLLGWRMTVARDLLCKGALSVKEVADRVGYGSASTFSTAFARHVGTPPSRFAGAQQHRSIDRSRA